MLLEGKKTFNLYFDFKKKNNTTEKYGCLRASEKLRRPKVTPHKPD